MPKGVRKNKFSTSLKTYEAFAANTRNQGHDFWTFHGINYLSDKPFPGIYRGDRVYRGAIFDHILANHFVNGALTPQGIRCLVWASATPPELYRSVVYVRGFVRKYKRDPLGPDDPYVKVAINTVTDILVGCTKGWGETKTAKITEYHKYPKVYTRDMKRASVKVIEHDPRSRGGWEFWADVHRKTIETYGLPIGVKPFRLEYRPMKVAGYVKYLKERGEPKASEP